MAGPGRGAASALFLVWDEVLIVPHLHGNKLRRRVLDSRKFCYRNSVSNGTGSSIESKMLVF